MRSPAKSRQTAKHTADGSPSVSDTAREAEGIFGPDVFASDVTWLLFAYWAGLYAIFGPLRESLQPLAQKYRNRPKTFSDKALQIVKRHFRNLSKTPAGQHDLKLFLWCDQKVRMYFPAPPLPQPPNSFPDDLSKRHLRAIDELIPIARQLIAGNRPSAVNPKKLLANLGAFASKRPGPTPDRLTRLIRDLDRRARAEGLHLTDGEIASKVFPRYASTWNSHRKQEARDMVKERRLPL